MKLPRVTVTTVFDGSEPLRKRAPAVDEDGKALSDFMVIFPGLKKKPALQIKSTVNEIHRILGLFGDRVVFAEMNLKINMLWVSIKPELGASFEITDAIRDAIPDARLVSHL